MVEGVEALIYLDTHVVAWLYAGRVDLLSPNATKLIESEELRISPAVILELECLRETGRLAVGGNTVVQSLSAQLGLRVCEGAFSLSLNRHSISTGPATRSTA